MTIVLTHYSLAWHHLLFLSNSTLRLENLHSWRKQHELSFQIKYQWFQPEHRSQVRFCLISRRPGRSFVKDVFLRWTPQTVECSYFHLYRAFDRVWPAVELFRQKHLISEPPVQSHQVGVSAHKVAQSGKVMLVMMVVMVTVMVVMMVVMMVVVMVFVAFQLRQRRQEALWDNQRGNSRRGRRCSPPPPLSPPPSPPLSPPLPVSSSPPSFHSRKSGNLVALFERKGQNTDDL